MGIRQMHRFADPLDRQMLIWPKATYSNAKNLDLNASPEQKGFISSTSST
jgi:hypothetical protein